MAKFKLFSDIHIHPWTAFAKLTKKGVNTRLVEIIEEVARIIAAAHEENCDAILCSGDLFHVPKVDAVTMDLTATLLRQSRIPIVMIPGNHDEASKMAQFHTLRSLHGNGKIIVLDDREGSTTRISGTKIRGIPYTTSRKALLESLDSCRDADIVLCHTGFAGATAGFDYIADQKNFVQAHKLGLEDSNIKLLVAGHFHQPQLMRPKDRYKSKRVEKDYEDERVKQGTILIPGAPVQHNFGDCGSLRGSWTFSTSNMSLRFLPGTCPKFVKVRFVPEERDSFARKIRANYVSCKVTEEVHLQDVREILQSEAKGFTIDLVSDTEKQGHKDRPRLRLEDRQDKTLKRYIKRSADSGDQKALLRTGLKLIQEAEIL